MAPDMTKSATSTPAPAAAPKQSAPEAPHGVPKSTSTKPTVKAAKERVPPSRATTSKIGLMTLPVQVQKSCFTRGGVFNVVLAGCRGTGKTTFLNTLIGEDLEEPSTPCRPMQVRQQKFCFEESGFPLELSVVEMPDFGVNLDNQYTWLPLVKYIEHNYRSYMVQEAQPSRERMRDGRVHACVYFIAPTNTALTPLDIESMKEISQRTNLIPVIARSDTLNRDELANFKVVVNHTLQEHGIKVCHHVCSAAVREKIAAHSPFAIIGSNMTFKNPEGKFVRARKYGWGMVEVENPDHCDFVHLRDLLVAEHMLDLMEGMQRFYNVFRSRALAHAALRGGESADSLAAAPEDDGLASYLQYKKHLSPDRMAMDDKYGDDDKLRQQAKNNLKDTVKVLEARVRELVNSVVKQKKLNERELDESYARIDALERDILKMCTDDKEVLRAIAKEAGVPPRRPLRSSGEEGSISGYSVLSP